MTQLLIITGFILWSVATTWGRDALISPLELELVLATQGGSPRGPGEAQEEQRLLELDLQSKAERCRAVADLVRTVGQVALVLVLILTL